MIRHVCPFVSSNTERYTLSGEVQCLDLVNKGREFRVSGRFVSVVVLECLGVSSTWVGCCVVLLVCVVSVWTDLTRLTRVLYQGVWARVLAKRAPGFRV